MRSKLCSSFLLTMVVTLVLATAAPAAPPRHNHIPYWSQRSPVGHVYFLPQVLETHRRMPLFFSWGMMSYKKSGSQFEFTLNGFNLQRRQAYTLVYYPGDAAPTTCLGQGTTNRAGFLNITAKADICSLPVAEDPNFSNGAMIMLVPSEDADCEEGVLFDPESRANLVGNQLIRFTDTDGCPAPEPEVTPPAEEESPADESGEVVDQGGETGDNGDETQPTDPESEPPTDENPPYNGMPY